MATTVFGAPVPSPGDINDVPTDMSQLAAYVGTRIVPRFGSVSEMTALFPSPAVGQICYVNNTMFTYFSAGWRKTFPMYQAGNDTEAAAMAALATSNDPVYVDRGGVLRRYTGASSYTQITPEDTGNINSGLAIVNAQYWAVSAYNMRKWGKHCQINIAFYSTAMTIVADSTGNFTDVLVFTIPAGWRPTIAWDWSWGGQRGIKEWYGRVNPDGTVYLSHAAYPGASLPSGTTVTFGATYLLP